MPETRHYIVEETRQIKIWANTAVDAASIANAVFDGHVVFDVPGGPESAIRSTGIRVEEDK